MSSGYLWVKAFHIVFVASWFAALFYLPRLFVNLADVEPSSSAERLRLLGMARRLYRFGSILMGVALVLGGWLLLGFGAWSAPLPGWLSAKLVAVAAAVGYHSACAGLLRGFEAGHHQRSHRWYRVFNEVAVLLFAAIVVLVVVKPF